jgi:hypothetical protein
MARQLLALFTSLRRIELENRAPREPRVAFEFVDLLSLELIKVFRSLLEFLMQRHVVLNPHLGVGRF